MNPASPLAVAEILPNWITDGEPVTVVIHNLLQFADQVVEASVFVFDSADTWWHTAVPVHLDSAGNGSEMHHVGLSVGRHAAVYIGEIRAESESFRFEHVLVSIANSPSPGGDLDAVMSDFASIQKTQTNLYEQPVGQIASEGALHYRAVVLIDALLTTIPIRLPGAVVRPVESKLTNGEHLEAVNARLAALGWATRIPADSWSAAVASQSHLSELIIPEIWATSLDGSMEIVRDVTARALTVLSRHRGSAGRAIATVIEQPRPDGGVNYRVLPHAPSYRGNLLGGPISGEDQRTIVGEYLAVDGDPVLRLASELYVEALSEQSPDASFFRLWSILEFLSGARVPSGTAVQRTDGTAWPGRYNTTSYAAPRVYKYIATALQANQIDERSTVAPAADLYHAVRGWYGRRNATGHYGRFVVADLEQQRQRWYQHALDTTHDEWQSLRSLERIVETMIASEMRTYAPAL